MPQEEAVGEKGAEEVVMAAPPCFVDGGDLRALRR